MLWFHKEQRFPGIPAPAKQKDWKPRDFVQFDLMLIMSHSVNHLVGSLWSWLSARASPKPQPHNRSSLLIQKILVIFYHSTFCFSSLPCFSWSIASAAAKRNLESNMLRLLTRGQRGGNTPKKWKGHSGEVPNGVRVDQPVGGREVEDLKSHTEGHQKHCTQPVQNVLTILPDWWLTRSKPCEMTLITCAGKTMLARIYSWDHQIVYSPLDNENLYKRGC